MKSWKTTVAMMAMAAAAMAMLSGCVIDSLAGAVTRPVAQVRTNAVTEIRTNVVTVTNFETVTVTNEVGAAVTRSEPQTVFVTNQVPVIHYEVVTNTVYVAKEGLASGIRVAEAGAAFVPPPYGEAAAGVLAALSAGLTLLVKRKNNDNANLTDQLHAVVHGVEQATAAIDPTAGEKVKAVIAQASKAFGVAEELHDTVQTVT